MESVMRKRLNYLVAILFLIGILSIIFSQKNPNYLDISYSKKLTSSPFLTKKIAQFSSSFDITIFCSDELANELKINQLVRWISAISPLINVTVLDHAKFPDKADHYDISNDGVIIIEHEGKRQDIDLIEQIILNEGHAIENIQNVISRAFLQLSQHTPPNILIVHSSNYSLIENTDPLGLASIKKITDQNFMILNEINVNDIGQISQQYDLIIFYKLGENAKKQLPNLVQLHSETPSSIIFNHPKFSTLMNDMVVHNNIQFSSRIIEDNTHHLLRSKNQLIIDYRTQSGQSLIGVFPYSGVIDFFSTTGIQPIAVTGEDAYFKKNNMLIPGPFPIIVQDKTNKRTYINNYLLATNFWLEQGDNHFIIEDIIQSHLDQFALIPIKEKPNTNIILTRQTIFTLTGFLIFMPVLLFSFLGFIRFKSSVSN